MPEPLANAGVQTPPVSGVPPKTLNKSTGVSFSQSAILAF